MKKEEMRKIKYKNLASWPRNLNVLEGYLKVVIKNQNLIIDWINKKEDKSK